jgi:hypothetical protein
MNCLNPGSSFLFSREREPLVRHERQLPPANAKFMWFALALPEQWVAGNGAV